ncbi:hypothetical protein [Desulfitobacterium sp. AusDCA]|uniref:hypothetical protein n=1 Tax=Desulfitobacterium sp. AusDCA TaxID=3240383 RepID=UPI003DA73CED
MDGKVYTVNILKDNWDIASVIGSLVTAFFTVALFFVAFIQLRNLIRSNTLSTVLNLETEVYQRKSKVDEITSKLRVAAASDQNQLAQIYADDLDAAIENYLNILDRLSYCVLNGYLRDRDWKTEYEDLITTTVQQNSSSFGPGTYYLNTKKLYEKWKSHFP